MRHQLNTEIRIAAPPQQVWQILTDLEGYASWNPFVISSSGRVAVGERLVNRMQAPGRKPQTFKPTVTQVEPARSFEWLGRLGLPGIFDGRHRFDLEPTGDGGTLLMHREFFSGILVRLLRRMVDTETRRGFELMNEALKSRAESNARVAP